MKTQILSNIYRYSHVVTRHILPQKCLSRSRWKFEFMSLVFPRTLYSAIKLFLTPIMLHFLVIMRRTHVHPRSLCFAVLLSVRSGIAERVLMKFDIYVLSLEAIPNFYLISINIDANWKRTLCLVGTDTVL